MDSCPIYCNLGGEEDDGKGRWRSPWPMLGDSMQWRWSSALDSPRGDKIHSGWNLVQASTGPTAASIPSLIQTYHISLFIFTTFLRALHLAFFSVLCLCLACGRKPQTHCCCMWPFPRPKDTMLSWIRTKGHASAPTEISNIRKASFRLIKRVIL